MAAAIGSYFFLLRKFRNGLALVQNLRHGGWLGQGPPLGRLVLWNGRVVVHPANRGGLAAMVLELWRDNEYQLGSFYRPRPGDLVVDVGAHIGLFTLQVLRIEPRARVVALEPSFENFSCLRQNLARLAPGADARAYQLAIGSSFGKVRMGPLPTNRSFDARTVPAEPGDADSVDAVPMSHVLELAGAERISLLKMDVEGAEFDVFSAIDDSLLARIERVALEYHDNYLLGTAALVHKRLARTHQVTVLPDKGEFHGRLFAVRNDLACPGRQAACSSRAGLTSPALHAGTG